MMADLDESIRDDLARLRARAGPSDDAKRRMWMAVEARVGPAPPDGDGGEGPGDLGSSGAGSGAGGLGQVGFAAKVVAATVAMTGAGLLTLRLGVAVVRSIAPGDAVEVSEATPEEDSGAKQPPAVAAAPAAVPSAPPSEDTTQQVRVAKPSAGARAPVSVDRPEVDRSLTAELALLQAAHDASSPQAVLEALDAHQNSFPAGQLMDERELLRVEALCTLGRIEAARTTAEALRGGGSSVASRAREICPAIDD